MTHSNAHSYPLPFPNKDQLMQISSYSSLANALGTDPGHTSRQRPHPPRCDASTNTQAIYMDGPPVSNPTYPYPARNVLNPGMRISFSVSNGRRSSNASVQRGENNDQKHLARLPSRYDRLPQPSFVETYQSGTEFPGIHFLRKGNKEPYSLWELLTMDTMPDLVAGDQPILMQSPERRIKIKLNWPGYSHHPFEKRIPIKQDAPITRTLLLMTLAYHIDEFVRWIRKECVIAESGQERWTAPAIWKDCVIASLQHRTGSTWQPEIYYLRG